MTCYNYKKSISEGYTMRGFILKKTAAVLSAVCIIVSLCACGSQKNEYSSFAMGSAVSASLYGKDKKQTDLLWNEISSAVTAADRLLSATSDGSDISRINSTGSAIVDSRTVSFLQKAVLLCNTLNRRLDITLGAVTALWGFTGATPSVPDESALKAALDTVNIDGVFIDEANRTVSVENGQKLDVGALGKGEACDIIKEKLLASDTAACISFGGNVLVTGENPNGKNGEWKIGMRDPLGSPDEVFAALSLKAENGALCVSTSGSYEKRFEENGKSYHHIINPDTGYPVENGLVSVSVICSSGLNADALSTALFVNGLNETSVLWLKSFGADAVFVFENGTVFVTDSICKNFTITNTDVYKTVSYEEAAK